MVKVFYYSLENLNVWFCIVNIVKTSPDITLSSYVSFLVS